MNQANRRAQQRPQPRPQPGRAPAVGRAAPAPRRDAVLPVLIIGGVIVIVLAYFMQCAMPNGFPLVTKKSGARSAVAEIYSGSVRINEIMASNSATLSTADGTSPDWIEIMNATSDPVNLQGYALAKSAGASNVLRFPDLQLAPGECAVVFADGKLRDQAGEALHAPFNIGAAGDTLFLFNAAGSAIDTVNVPALGRDQSYARTGRESWVTTYKPTPGLENSDASYTLLHTKDENSPVVISEICASNATLLADQFGVYSDFIRLTNRSDEAVNLGGWYLSDDESAVWKWQFPDVTLNAGETITVFASGQSVTDDPEHLHAGFALSSEGEQVALTDAQGRLKDIVTFGLLKKDQIWKRQ